MTEQTDKKQELHVNKSIGTKYSIHEFGTDGLWKPESLIQLSKKRRDDNWAMDTELKTRGYVSDSINRKFATIGNVFGIRPHIVLNSAIKTGSYYLHHWSEYCGDNLDYVNIFKILESINNTAPFYEVDVEEGTNAHRPFFGALESATNDYNMYMNTNLVRSKERKHVRFEMDDELRMLLGSLRWIKLSQRDAIDVILMSGLTIDSILDRDSWEMYKKYIPDGYIGAPGAFIRSLGSISEIIIKMEKSHD